MRGHLEVLGAAGIIGREQGQRESRGRPPWLYRVVETPLMTERRQLAAELAQELDHSQLPELAEIAAEKWAEQVNTAYSTLTAQNPDELVREAGRSLTNLGFEVTINPVGDRIDLAGCPYADLIDDHPVICDIHAAFLDQLFDNGPGEVSLNRLQVWVKPGVCSALLNRADLAPAREISGHAQRFVSPNTSDVAPPVTSITPESPKQS